MAVALGDAPKKGGPSPDINITPLVDIVLVLLIIFMVMTPQMDKHAAVELPQINNADKNKIKKDPVEVTLEKNGDITIEKKPYDMASLEALLMQAHAENPEREFVLRADKDLEFKKMREMMNMVRNVGFPRTAFSVAKGAKAKDDEVEAPE